MLRYCILLGSLAIAWLTCGCGPGPRPELSAEKISFKRTGWFRLVSADGKIVGYEEKCSYSSRSGGNIRFVYNARLVKVGFITPRRVVYRYLRDGSSEKVGLFPGRDQQAECALLGVFGPLKIIDPGKRKSRELKPTIVAPPAAPPAAR